MSDKSLSPAYVAKIASLGGFLEGISFLNQDCCSNFAEAFSVEASDESEVLADIQSRFTHLPELALKSDEGFQGGFRQLEQDISSLLLVKPHVSHEQLAQDMRSYLSFKIMDRLDDIANFGEFMKPRRFVGIHGEIDGSMIFYLLRSPEIWLVLYFSSSVSNS
ncbi:hypothetical protein [Ruegeria jejuensis]|uniref:hypothetical protein n=1 Tax=Ruegeria jejuensis TaxID=3233338 RepID=UPI00355B28B6